MIKLPIVTAAASSFSNRRIIVCEIFNNDICYHLFNIKLTSSKIIILLHLKMIATLGQISDISQNINIY